MVLHRRSVLPSDESLSSKSSPAIVGIPVIPPVADAMAMPACETPSKRAAFASATFAFAPKTSRPETAISSTPRIVHPPFSVNVDALRTSGEPFISAIV